MGITLTSTTPFINLGLSGINPAAVAWYEFQPVRTLVHETNGVVDGELAVSDNPLLTVILLNGAALEIDGDEAQTLFAALQQAGTSILPLSAEKQNALDSLKAFFATAFADGYTRAGHLAVTPEAKATAEQALSVLGA
jgi:lambda repressor-like predicted transcriptional regulator